MMPMPVRESPMMKAVRLVSEAFPDFVVESNAFIHGFPWAIGFAVAHRSIAWEYRQVEVDVTSDEDKAARETYEKLTSACESAWSRWMAL